MKSNVPVAEAINDEAVLPHRVQEALGQLVGAAREGKAPDNRHEKGNERVLHRKTKQVTMAPSHASATREGAAKR